MSHHAERQQKFDEGCGCLGIIIVGGLLLFTLIVEYLGV